MGRLLLVFVLPKDSRRECVATKVLKIKQGDTRGILNEWCVCVAMLELKSFVALRRLGHWTLSSSSLFGTPALRSKSPSATETVLFSSLDIFLFCFFFFSSSDSDVQLTFPRRQSRCHFFVRCFAIEPTL